MSKLIMLVIISFATIAYFAMTIKMIAAVFLNDGFGWDIRDGVGVGGVFFLVWLAPLAAVWLPYFKRLDCDRKKKESRLDD
jgi:hypothetical protein